MGRLRKFWSLPRREKEFLCEASILLCLSNATVKAVAFRHIDRFLRTRWNDAVRDGANREQEIRRVRLSISRAATLFPWKSQCLSRSITEFIMLRRRRIPAAIFVGARFSGQSSLEAHAWVDTTLWVNDIGSENSDFTPLIKIGTEAVDR
jgi:hypothetical protein